MTVNYVSSEPLLRVVTVLTDFWVNATAHAAHASSHTAAAEHVIGVDEIST
jgi:hypothetical protein